ncbi:MAG: PHP-associated domain-containing protein [Suipraeoptans sp.]
MFIDMHMHEKTFSADSFLSLKEMVEIARVKGLGGICVTDHDDMGLKEYAAWYSKKEDFPIFVGIEYYSLQGDIVAFGINDYPKVRISAQEFVNMVKEQNGICFAAHPFRDNNRGLEDNLDTIQGLDGVEVLNGNTSLKACILADEYVKKYGYIPIGSSDCHIKEKVGVYATYFPREVKTLKELIEVFKEGDVKPAYYFEGKYHILANICLPKTTSVIEYIYN